jgi:hypothetical protein
MAKAVVLSDLYRYHEKTGDTSSLVLEATQGETVDVSDAELKRGLDLEALAKPNSREAKALKDGDPVADEPTPTTPAGDPVDE